MGLLSASARVAAGSAAALLALSPLAASAAAVGRTVPVIVPLSGKPELHTAWTVADETARDRDWRGYRRHRGGIDGGDVLAGILVIGGIAAIASAVDKSQQDRRTDRTEGRDYPDRAGRSGDAPYGYRSDGTRAPDYGSAGRDDDRDDYRAPAQPQSRYGRDPREADSAVRACTAEAGSSGRVDQVFGVDRDGAEWRVEGDYADGREFTCTVDASGRAFVGLGQQSQAQRWDDPRGDDAADPDPRAQPGSNADDDRYSTSRSPDFSDPRGG